MFTKTSIIALAFGALLVAGCQSNAPAPASANRSPSPAIVCDQCKTTWVQTPVLNEKGRPVPFAYTTKQATVCPECAQAAKGYFATGKFEPCKTCGGSRQLAPAAQETGRRVGDWGASPAQE